MSSPETDRGAAPIVGAVAINGASPLDGVAMIYGAAPHVGAARLVGAVCLDGVARHDEADDVNEPDLYKADDVNELDEADDPFPSSQVSFRINFDGDDDLDEINPSQVLFTQDEQTRSFVGSQYAYQTALRCYYDALRTPGLDVSVYYSWLVDARLAITINPPTLPPRPLAPIFQRELWTLLVKPLSITEINPQHKQWIRKTMLNDWGIGKPQDFQIKAIIQAAFF
jgi:hypothetical protein